MAVYVDKARHPFGRMVMCHMMADTLEELHAMADQIGVARRWFQNKRSPHYDICLSKRALAVGNGAVECGREKIVELHRRWLTEYKRLLNADTAPQGKEK